MESESRSVGAQRPCSFYCIPLSSKVTKSGSSALTHPHSLFLGILSCVEEGVTRRAGRELLRDRVCLVGIFQTPFTNLWSWSPSNTCCFVERNHCTCRGEFLLLVIP